MTDSGDDRRDHMAPPQVPCECWCLHCHRTFMSDKIWFQKVVGDPSGFEGFWMCPTPNCDGAGFTFDIFPTDPNHPANEGWHYCDDEDDDEDGEYDPTESKYSELDEEMGDEDDDLEGEEWKLGLQPGERPPTEESPEQAQARREWEEEQKRYDAPDERPREIQWKDTPRAQSQPPFNDDDIPF